MTTRPELSGNQKRKMRTASRLYAVQALFQMEHSGQASDVVAREFLITVLVRSMMKARCKKAIQTSLKKSSMTR